MSETNEFWSWKWITCIGLAVLVCGCKPQPVSIQAQKPQAPAEVKTTKATRGEITRFVVLPGNVTPNQQATLYAKVGGYLEAINVDKGDAVKKGDLMARIQAPELLADLAKLKADLELAQVENDRAIKAREKAPDLMVSQSVDAARARFLAAKASLERAETLIGFCEIRAPFAGTVTRRMVDPGAFIPAATSGSAAQNAAIVTLMDSSVVRVQTLVPEPEVPLIRKGLPVQVLIEELAGQVFKGTVTRYSQYLDEARTMMVEVELANEEGVLLPGMYATVRVGVETHKDALLLPSDAVVMEKVNAFAFVVKENQARKVALKTGFRDGAMVEVLGGVATEDAVILAGKKTFADGQPVVAMEGK